MNHLLESLIDKAKKDPNTRVFFRICEEYRKTEDHPKVIENGLLGLECDEHHLPTLLVVGKSLSELNQLEKASTYFQKVLKLDPENIRATFGMASCLVGMGFAGEAEPYIDNLRILQPSLVSEFQITEKTKDVIVQTHNEIVEEEQIAETVQEEEVNDPGDAHDFVDKGEAVEQTISPSERKLLRLKNYLSTIRSNSCV